MRVLIDGDIIAYRMAWACQKKHYQHIKTGEFFEGKRNALKWLKEEYLDDFREEDWDIVEEIEPWPNCKFLVDNCISDIRAETKADETIVYLSPSKCFRHSIATIQPYKDGRPPPPFFKKKIFEYLQKSYLAEVADNMEADDLLGLNQDTDTVIASVDKDLHMIPGRHYDIVKKTKMTIDMKAADDWFFVQLLSGDRTDNIRGIPGIGPKTAIKILDQFEGNHAGLVNQVRELYEEHYPGHGMAAMVETAQLVYILRKGDVLGDEQWRKLLLVDESISSP